MNRILVYGFFLALIILSAGIAGCTQSNVNDSNDGNKQPDNGNENKQPTYTEEESKEIARDFVESSPTYQFDGHNLTHKETLYPDVVNCTSCYGFVFEFESRHAGYGNRTGKMLAQVITPHEAHITVKNGEVTSALLDMKWDMINQTLVDAKAQDDELDLREANVVDVEIEELDGSYKFDVTLYHDDDGEDGYANWWKVETLNGEELGRRDLTHAHGTQQFTRSQDIEVPQEVKYIVVRGHDQIHEYGGQVMIVNLETGESEKIKQDSEKQGFRDYAPEPIGEKTEPKSSSTPQEGFCGWSTQGNCSTDADCTTGGCSGEVCQSKFEDSVITTCEYKECYNADLYDMECKCVEGACQWSQNTTE